MSLLGCLSIVSFQVTGAAQQPVFYIGILSALLWPYCILFFLYLSLFLLLLASGRGEINHTADPRVPMSGYLPLMDLNELCLQMNADSLFVQCPPPPHPTTYRLRTSRSSTLTRHPISPVTHISTSLIAAALLGSLSALSVTYPSCSRRDKDPWPWTHLPHPSRAHQESLLITIPTTVSRFFRPLIQAINTPSHIIALYLQRQIQIQIQSRRGIWYPQC